MEECDDNNTTEKEMAEKLEAKKVQLIYQCRDVGQKLKEELIYHPSVAARMTVLAKIKTELEKVETFVSAFPHQSQQPVDSPTIATLTDNTTTTVDFELFLKLMRLKTTDAEVVYFFDDAFSAYEAADKTWKVFLSDSEGAHIDFYPDIQRRFAES